MFLFIALLPTNGFVSTEYNLLGVIHSSYIIYFFSFIALLLEWSSLSKQEEYEINQYRKLLIGIITLLVFFFFYSILLNIKKDILGLESISFQLLLTRTIRAFLFFGSLFIILKLSRLSCYLYYLRKGFMFSLVIISLGAIFSNLWQNLGIYIGSDEVQNFGFEVRRSGFWGLSGDENSLAGFLAIGFAYTLFKHQRNYQWVLLVISLGILSTGSRTGVLNILLILVFFFIARDVQIKSKSRLFIFLIIAMVFGLYFGVFSNIIERFLALGTGEDKGLDSSATFGRVGGWLLYLRFIFSDYSVFFFGTFESLYKALGINYYERVAHNFFIQLWYYWGIFALSFFLYILRKIFIQSKKIIERNALIAIFIPFVVTLFTVSDTGVCFSFIIAFTCTIRTKEEFDHLFRISR
jgi:hypothetical protein